MNNLIARKLFVILIKFINIFVLMPKRLLRLFLHLLYPILRLFIKIPSYRIIRSPVDWVVMIPFYIIDILGIPEIYEIFSELVFFKIRDLTDYEILIARQIFKEKINYKSIRINENNFVAGKLNIAYVSFSHINSNRTLNDGLFIHEMVHIWQYYHFGSVYIYHALKAQFSNEGYNYGGVSNLLSSKKLGMDLLDYNFEQQGDIIQDIAMSNRYLANDQLMDYINDIENLV